MRKALLATTALFLTLALPAPAHADPLTAGITAIVASIGEGLTVANVALTIASFAATTLLNALLAPDAPKDKGTKQDMERGGDKPPKFIAGIYATPGHLLYHNSYSNHRNIYVLVSILSSIPVQGLGNLVGIAGETCEIDFAHPDADGFCPVKEYVKYGNTYCDVKFHAGGQNVADPWLVETFGDDPDWPWLADMIVKGCAYTITRCLHSTKGIWAGNPEFMWTVQGIALYDPRRDSTVGGSGSHRWGNTATYGGAGDTNPVIQKYNIARGIYYNGKHYWGGNAEAYRLPLDYVFAAANACDVTITKKNGDVIKSFETGMEISLDEKPIDVIKDIDRCSSSYTAEYGGTYKFFAGKPGLSVMTITDEDFLITEKGTDDPFKPIQETYNSVVATFPDIHAGWVMDAAPLYQDADYLAADDGQESVLDIQLPYATEHNQVQRVGRTAIREGRSQLSHTGVLPPIAFILEPHDRVNYISKREGYTGSGVGFLIGTKISSANLNQQVSLRSINPDAHIYLPEMELDHTVGKTKPIRQGALDVVFTISPSYTETENGQDKPAIAVAWDWAAVDVDVDRVNWRVRLAGTTEIIAHGTINDIEDGHYKIVHNALRFKKDYEVEFYPRPISLRASDRGPWQSVTTVDLSKPASPTLLVKASLAPDGTPQYKLKADWPTIAGEVTYKVEAVEVTDANRRRVIPIDVSKWSETVSAGDHFIIRVATKASDGGTQSDWSDPAEITVAAIEPGVVSVAKTRQRTKPYAGIVTVGDDDFLTVSIANTNGAPVKISWEWILTARYAVAAASQTSSVLLRVVLWKKHGAGAKQVLQTINAKVSHPRGLMKKLTNSVSHQNSKVFNDQHPKKGATTYGIDVLYRGAGTGTLRAAVRKCHLNISFDRRST